MIFTETKLKGAFIIEQEPRIDHRGFFSRTFCAQEFEKHGLESNMVQSNLSYSKEKYTLRGMHFQTNGHEEVKLVRCTKGKILDTIVDLRPESATYCESISVELTPENFRMLYVPRGFAHGFLTLEEDSEIFYQVSAFYSQENERGVRWNDPAFNIDWPVKNPILSEKDKNHADYIK